MTLQLTLPFPLPCYCGDPNCSIIYGCCHCGCGQKTVPFRFGSKRDSVTAGEPRQYIKGHKRKLTEETKRKIAKLHTYLVNGEYVDGRITPTYSAWKEMQRRCYDCKRKDFPYYGGRGITVCERWRESFVDFREDMGECPASLSLDRVNVNGNYEPGNCRWATKVEQMNNTRHNIHVEWNGTIMTVAQVARVTGTKTGLLRQRLNRGMPVKSAVSKPVELTGKYAKLA